MPMEPKIVAICFGIFIALVSFQNCSKVDFKKSEMAVVNSSEIPTITKVEDCQVNGVVVETGNEFNIPAGFTTSSVPAGATCVQDAFKGICFEGIVTFSHEPFSSTCTTLEVLDPGTVGSGSVTSVTEPVVYAPPQVQCLKTGEEPYHSGSLANSNYTHCFTDLEEKKGLYVGKVITNSTTDVYISLPTDANRCCSKSLVVTDVESSSLVCTKYGVARIICQ